jgi:uncharacterized repeat protein (TIGR01451 family)
MVSNDGDGDAVGVVVTDTLPPGVIGEDLDWTGTVTAGEQVEFIIAAEVTTDTAFYDATITNTAYLSHSSGSDSSEVAFTVESAPPEPVLDITKTVELANDPALLGDPITYTVVVANDGDGDAVGVVVTDTLPVGVIGEDLDWTGTVTAGEQVEFIIPAAVTTDTAFYGATITNTAYLSHSSSSDSVGVTFTVESEAVHYRIYLPVVLKVHGGAAR